MLERAALIVSDEGTLGRALTIAAVAVLAVALVHVVRRAGQRVLAARTPAYLWRARTLATLLESTLVFAIAFAAVGLVLRELGISLTAYLASASIIGLAVGFGSQGLVQDVVTGLTLLVSGAFDVGEMVELSGQTGVVRSLGMRFTTLVNFVGAEVLVPNRNITNVIVYPKGYVRAFLDAQLPRDESQRAGAERVIRSTCEAAHQQFPAIILTPPVFEGTTPTPAGYDLLRVGFRIWPGQGGVIESAVRPRLVQGLRAVAPDYADWMISVTYRAEPKPPPEPAPPPQ